MSEAIADRTEFTPEGRKLIDGINQNDHLFALFNAYIFAEDQQEIAELEGDEYTPLNTFTTANLAILHALDLRNALKSDVWPDNAPPQDMYESYAEAWLCSEWAQQYERLNGINLRTRLLQSGENNG